MNKLTVVLSGITALTGITASAWELDLGKNHKIDFHGFASQGFLKSDSYNYLGESGDDGSFQFTEAGINASYSPFDRMRISVQGFTYDIGRVGDFEIILDYASAEYTFNNYFGVRGGRVRRPGGIYNHIQDVDLARTSILLPQGIYDARWRDFRTSVDGGLIFGSIPLGKGGSLSYEGYLGYSRLSDKGGIARSSQNSLKLVGGTYYGLDPVLTGGGQVWWNTPISGLRAGVSFNSFFDYTSHTRSGGIDREGISDIAFGTLSLEYQWKNWTFQSEYYSNNSVGKTYNETTGALLARTRSHPDAWYFGTSYRFSKWFELGSYYSEYYADSRDRNLNGSAAAFQKDVALSARFDIRDWWVFKLEGHYIRGVAQLQDSVTNPAAGQNRDGWWLFAAKTTFSF